MFWQSCTKKGALIQDLVDIPITDKKQQIKADTESHKTEQKSLAIQLQLD